MAILTVQHGSPDGSASFVPVAATGGGDSFPNTGREQLYVKNGGVAPVTLTFNAPGPCNFNVVNDVHDLMVIVPAGGEKFIGPLSGSRFNDANGRVQVAYSGATGVLVAAVAG